ncbi:response regulator [bacterium]|nr:response regulator [bacterium]
MTNILIIEDNEINMKLFADILEAKSYSVTKIFDGKEGYEEIKKQKYDLVILDIQLPSMNGFEILEHLHDDAIELPKILIVSAFAMEHEIAMAKQLGVKNYLTKPIDVMNFIGTVSAILSEDSAL